MTTKRSQPLTSLEKKALNLYISGLTYDEIARRMRISRRRVEDIMNAAYAKKGFKSGHMK